MAKPNYGFEKRQRETAKKKKKEDKLRAKAERKAEGGQPASGEPGEPGEPGGTDDGAVQPEAPAPGTPTP